MIQSKHFLEKQSKLKSKSAWVATISLILFILKTYFDIEIEKVDLLIDLGLIVLAEWGIFSDVSIKK